MKLHTAFGIAFLGLATLACGGGGGGGGMSSIPSASLTEPWSSMNLPIDKGSVMYSDGTTLSITYGQGKPDKIAAKYEEAIKGAGWTESFRSGDDTMVNASYTKDGGNLTLSVVEAMGTVTVAMTKS